MQPSVVQASSIYILSTCSAPEAQGTQNMPPYIDVAPHEHHAACRHPIVCPKAIGSATSTGKKAGDSRALLAEKVPLAYSVKVWLHPQRSCCPAPRQMLWRH